MLDSLARGVKPRTVLRIGAAIVVLGLIAALASVLVSRCSASAPLGDPDPKATKPVLAGVLPGDGGRLANPIGIAWDGKRLYVCESDAGSIAVFDARGVLRGRIEIPSASGATTAYPAAVCVLEGGDVAVVDAAASRVLVVDAGSFGEADVVREIGVQAGLSQPTALASSSGRLYVADASDGTIKVFDGGEKPVAVLGADLKPRLTFVTGMAVADSSLFVVDSNAGRVVELDAATGSLLGSVPARFTLPRGVATLGDGRVAVADAFERRIAVFFEGRQTGSIDASSVPGAPLGSLRGLAWDEERGRLFATDARSGSVGAYDVPRDWGKR